MEESIHLDCNTAALYHMANSRMAVKLKGRGENSSVNFVCEQMQMNELQRTITCCDTLLLCDSSRRVIRQQCL
jgi:hypothetical protein